VSASAVGNTPLPVGNTRLHSSPVPFALSSETLSVGLLEEPCNGGTTAASDVTGGDADGVVRGRVERPLATAVVGSWGSGQGAPRFAPLAIRHF
jgi:hypothetical protein